MTPHDRRIKSFSYSFEDDLVVDAAQKIAERERANFSQVVVAALKEFVHNHVQGNPQKPLFPPKTVYTNPVTENMSEIFDDLLADIRSHPGHDLFTLAADWGRVHGRRMETAIKMIRQLQYAKKVVIRGTKVYAIKKRFPPTIPFHPKGDEGSSESSVLNKYKAYPEGKGGYVEQRGYVEEEEPRNASIVLNTKNNVDCNTNNKPRRRRPQLTPQEQAVLAAEPCEEPDHGKVRWRSEATRTRDVKEAES